MSDVIGIVGAGNTASALAAYLCQRGHRVLMLVRDLGKAEHLNATNSVRAHGLVEGTFALEGVTLSVEELAYKCATIFVATTADCYHELAKKLLPFVTKKHVIITFSSKLFGSLEFRQVFTAAGGEGPLVIETDALFACRLQVDGSIVIKGLKDWTLYSCPQRSETFSKGSFVKEFFPNLEPADNVMQRGCTDFGAHAHTIITLANISKVDGKVPFLFYYEGLSPKTAVLLDALETEIKQVALRYETPVISMKDLLNSYYGCDNSGSLYRAMTSVGPYATINGPDALNCRFLYEDVGCTLVPLRELGRRAGVETPLLDAVVHLSCLLTGRELKAEGRTLARIGWQEMSVQQIIQWMVQ